MSASSAAAARVAERTVRRKFRWAVSQFAHALRALKGMANTNLMTVGCVGEEHRGSPRRETERRRVRGQGATCSGGEGRQRCPQSTCEQLRPGEVSEVCQPCTSPAAGQLRSYPPTGSWSRSARAPSPEADPPSKHSPPDRQQGNSHARNPPPALASSRGCQSPGQGCSPDRFACLICTHPCIHGCLLTWLGRVQAHIPMHHCKRTANPKGASRFSRVSAAWWSR